MPWIRLEGPSLAADSGNRNHRSGRDRNRPALVSRLRRHRARGEGLTMSLIDADAAREAVTQLEALARELAERNFETRVTSDGGTPSLSVINPATLSSRETIAVAPADDGAWWFWWSWGNRIARITDVGTAAFKIAYVLIPQADDALKPSQE
jgi:hypothetical protein